MKRINLYFDFEFTSLSPDAQIISLGIVSDEIIPDLVKFEDLDKSKMTDSTIEKINDDKIEILNVSSVEFDDKNWVTLCNGIEEILIVPKKDIKIESKSFCAELNDFDINRCDDWVKENVVGKLKYIKDTLHIYEDDNNGNVSCVGKTEHIKDWVKDYIAQFSDYEIQFVCDCGTFDWYHLLQLIGEWEYKFNITHIIDCEGLCDNDIYDLKEILKDNYTILPPKYRGRYSNINSIPTKIGLPKLPPNISPVPFDLNDLISIRKGISPREAFYLDREELAFGWVENQERIAINEFKENELATHGFKEENKEQKHNSLWDAKVIKAIYNKLM